MGLLLVAKNELRPLADGWVRLFNGKDLSGWKRTIWRRWELASRGRGHRRSRGQSVLVISVQRIGVRHFHLRVEAKINAIGDSGVSLRRSSTDCI